MCIEHGKNAKNATNAGKKTREQRDKGVYLISGLLSRVWRNVGAITNNVRKISGYVGDAGYMGGEYQARAERRYVVRIYPTVGKLSRHGGNLSQPGESLTWRRSFLSRPFIIYRSILFQTWGSKTSNLGLAGIYQWVVLCKGSSSPTYFNALQRIKSASHSTISAPVYQRDGTLVILARVFHGGKIFVISSRVYQARDTSHLGMGVSRRKVARRYCQLPAIPSSSSCPPITYVFRHI